MSNGLFHIVSHRAASKFSGKSAEQMQELLIRRNILLGFVPKHAAVYSMKYPPRLYQIYVVLGEKILHEKTFRDQPPSSDTFKELMQDYAVQEEPPYLLITYPEVSANLEQILSDSGYSTQMYNQR